MSLPVLPLRAAIRESCLADPGLADLMGGEVRLHDEPPRNAEPVYGVFGDVTLRDVSGSEGRIWAQELAVVVWAKAGSAASGLLVAERLAERLDDAALSPSGHRLVHLAVTGLVVERDRESGLVTATLRLRAVTEAA